MKVSKKTLILLAGIVWLIAGVNIMAIGIQIYKPYLNLINLVLSSLVFCFFWFMIFSKLVRKHTKRISSYQEEYHLFLKFFDKKSYIIMIFMMTMGICLRKFHLVPDIFIAVFYSGLGFALGLAGILFLYNYFKIWRRNKNA